MTKTLTKYACAIVTLVAIVACSDRYRYKCQDPDHFHALECQKPRCLFTQTCPEYLVAPILEKQVNAQQPQASDAR